MSYALDSTSATLHAGAASLVPFADYYPYQPTFALPARPITGAQVVYIGTKADSTSLPSRDALKGKVVVFRSSASGNSLGAPDLSPQGPLGLIAGIGVTEIDPLLSQFADYLRGPKVEIREATYTPPGATQPRMLFIPTASVEKIFGKPLDALRPGDTGPALRAR